MSIEVNAYVHGYQTNRPECLCPHCGQRLKREWQYNIPHNISRCVNSDCNYLESNKHNKLVRAIRQKTTGGN